MTAQSSSRAPAPASTEFEDTHHSQHFRKMSSTGQVHCELEDRQTKQQVKRTSTHGPIHCEDVDTHHSQQVSSRSGGEWEGLVISSDTCEYRLIAAVGSGGDGHVFQAVNLNSRAKVAIKTFSCTEQGLLEALLEVDMLTEIQDLDPDRCNLVKFHEWFVHDGYPCLVFELLCGSLLDLLNERNTLSPYEIRPIAQQLLVAFKALKNTSIMHCDLKANNVMPVDHVNKPFKLKLIDFGLAQFKEDVGFGDIIQYFSNRAPEVLLGIPITEAAEMWSLGCLLACLFLRSSLCPGGDEYDVISHIVDTHEKPDYKLLSDCLRTKNLFTRDSSRPNVWRLKTPEQYKRDTSQEPNETREHIFKNLSQLKQVYKCAHKTEEADLSDFLDLLKRMLTLDPRKRITPTEALQHRFITMRDLQKFSDSTYYKTSVHSMESCSEDLREPEDNRTQTDSGSTEKKEVSLWKKAKKFFSRVFRTTLHQK